MTEELVFVSAFESDKEKYFTGDTLYPYVETLINVQFHTTVQMKSVPNNKRTKSNKLYTIYMFLCTEIISISPVVSHFADTFSKFGCFLKSEINILPQLSAGPRV